MERIKLLNGKIKKDKLNKVVECLNRGEVIVYLSDTIYGLGCRADCESAIKHIYRIKERCANKPLLIFVSSIEMLKEYAEINQAQRDYLNSVWPGPTTVILKSKNKLPLLLSSGKDTLAVRLPKNEILCKMIGKAEVPLISTSFNFSGKITHNNPDDIIRDLGKEKPDLFIDSGQAKTTKASKIINIQDVDNIKIIRK